MNVLGFDTSTAVTSACLLLADDEAFEVIPETAALGGPPRHASELLPALADVLDRGGLDWAEVDAVAVGVGPGTFTGLRIGVATARALAHAHDAELRPVSSLAALAAGIPEELRLPVLDAKRGEVFTALYRGEEELWPPQVASPQDVAAQLRREGVTPLAAGDGSVRFRGILEAAGARVAPDESAAHVIRALHVCRLARDAPAATPEAVLPQYLRLPDAQPQR